MSILWLIQTVDSLIEKLKSARAFSAFRGKELEELEELQADFDTFRSVFDRSISVQTMITANNLASRLEDLREQFTELGTFMQAVFEQF